MDNQDQFRLLARKYFGFLEVEFGFVYIVEKDAFENHVIRIYIEQIDYVTPSIMIWRKSEPKFTGVDISWLFSDFINSKNIDNNSLEENLAFYASLLREHTLELINTPEKMILKGLKLAFLSMCRLARIDKKNFLPSLNASFDTDLKKYYYYIKKRDRFWNPSKDL